MFLNLSMTAALLLGQVATVAEIPAAIVEARGLQADGKLDKARDIYERVLLLRPADAEAQAGIAATSEQLALAERAAGHMDTSLNILLRAQRAAPENKRILLDLGILEDEVLLFQEAAKTLEHL